MAPSGLAAVMTKKPPGFCCAPPNRAPAAFCKADVGVILTVHLNKKYLLKKLYKDIYLKTLFPPDTAGSGGR